MPGSSHLMPRDPKAFSGFCSGDFTEEMSLKPLSAFSLFGNACLEESFCLTFLSVAVVSSTALGSPLQIYISTEQKSGEQRHPCVRDGVCSSDVCTQRPAMPRPFKYPTVAGMF